MKKLSNQARNNERTFTIEDDDAHRVTIETTLHESVSWKHADTQAEVCATDEGVQIQIDIPDTSERAWGRATHTIELKDVPLRSLYSCLANVDITGVCLIELANSERTLKSAVRQMQLAALVKRGLISLKIRFLPSFYPEANDAEWSIIFTLEVNGVPFSTIQQDDSPLSRDEVREIFSFTESS